MCVDEGALRILLSVHNRAEPPVLFMMSSPPRSRPEAKKFQVLTSPFLFSTAPCGGVGWWWWWVVVGGGGMVFSLTSYAHTRLFPKNNICVCVPCVRPCICDAQVPEDINVALVTGQSSDWADIEEEGAAAPVTLDEEEEQSGELESDRSQSPTTRFTYPLRSPLSHPGHVAEAVASSLTERINQFRVRHSSGKAARSPQRFRDKSPPSSTQQQRQSNSASPIRTGVDRSLLGDLQAVSSSSEKRRETCTGME